MTISITALKNTKNIVALCQSHSEPVFVTQNGYAELVVMSVEYYQQYQQKQNAMGEEDDRRLHSHTPPMLPIKSLKMTGELSTFCKSANEPVVITRNGNGVLMIMSTKAYDSFMEECLRAAGQQK